MAEKIALSHEQFEEIPPVNLIQGDYEFGIDEKPPLWEVVVRYSGDILKIGRELNVGVEILNANYAIVTLDLNKLRPLASYPEIQFIEKPKRGGLTLFRSLESSCITTVQRDKNLNLTGKGVIVAVLDSGIDYRSNDFRNIDGTTRIMYLWDQTIKGKPPEGFKQGTEYTQEEINKALELPPEEGYRIVPSRDDLGHGTAVTGIAAGNGRNSDGENIGVAPESPLIIIKLGEAGGQLFDKTTSIMRGLKYIIDKSSALNMPVAINISFGTNDGSHDGSSLFETYIDEMNDTWRSSIVVATGNEGAAGHHYEGIAKTGEVIDVDFTVAPGLKLLTLNLWKSFSDIFTFEIIGPGGKSSGEIQYAEFYRRFSIDDVQIYVFVGQPAPYTVNQEIAILMVPLYPSGFNGGVWKLRVTGKDVVQGKFNIWLPITEASTLNTYFLAPSTNTTLTLPSTAKNVISVGAYNPDINAIADFSGTGNTRFDRDIKPDLVAPGVKILSPSPGGGYDTVTGTSFAAPHVTGAAALLMQWGVINRKDPLLYGQRLKAFLQLGATRDANIDYPNIKWGFGKLCLSATLDYLKEFSQLNQSIVNPSSNKLSTSSLMKVNNSEAPTSENILTENIEGTQTQTPEIAKSLKSPYSSNTFDIILKKSDIDKFKELFPDLLYSEPTGNYAIV